MYRSFRFPSVSLLLLLLTSAMQLHAAYEGTWTFEEPELGDMYLILKSDGTGSYFLAEGMETTIKKGTWTQVEEAVDLKFDNGVTGRLVLSGEDMGEITLDLADAHGLAQRGSKMAVSRVPAGKIGSLTVDPGAVNTDEEEEEEDKDSFTGYWEGELLSGDKFFMVVDANRTAGCTHSFSLTDQERVLGYWRKDGPEMYIYWSDGSFTILKRVGRRVEQTTIPAGALLEDAKGFSCRMIAVTQKDLPEAWYAEFDKDYVGRASFLVFRTRSQVKDFFKGEWYVGPDRREDSMIRLGWMKGAKTQRFGGVKGEWFLDQDAVVIRWKNGVTEWIRPIGRAFLVNSYNPGQPLQGRPARIQLVFPAEEEKIEKYFETKKRLMGLAAMMSGAGQ